MHIRSSIAGHHTETEAADLAVYIWRLRNKNLFGQLGHIGDLHRTKHKAVDFGIDTYRGTTDAVAGKKGRHTDCCATRTIHRGSILMQRPYNSVAEVKE